MKNKGKRRFKEAVYGQLARIGKSLASGPRLEMLDLLCQGPRTVDSLAGQVGQSMADSSRHLQVLRRVETVERLRAAGFEASQLDEGVADWRARGLPVELASTEQPGRFDVGPFNAKLKKQEVGP